jgi:hypothetical protein
VIDVLQRFLAEYDLDDLTGKLAVVTESRIRLRDGAR